jgi:hypothetical protein
MSLLLRQNVPFTSTKCPFYGIYDLDISITIDMPKKVLKKKIKKKY